MYWIISIICRGLDKKEYSKNGNTGTKKRVHYRLVVLEKGCIILKSAVISHTKKEIIVNDGEEGDGVPTFNADIA